MGLAFGMDPEAVIDQRHVSPLLAVGIVALPLIFVWLLLRKGYAPSTRWSGFIYTGVMTARRDFGARVGVKEKVDPGSRPG